MPHVEALTLVIYSSGQSVLLDQRVIAYPLFLNKKGCHALVRSQVLKQVNELIAFPGFWP